MTRFCCLVVAFVAVAAVLAFGTLAVAQQGGVAAQPMVVRSATAQIPAVPGYHMLRMQHVQDQLELTDEQLATLKDLGKKYYEGMRHDWSGFKDLSTEERQAKYAEIREKNQKLSEDMRKQVEEVLVPHQIDLLKKINFQSTGPYALSNPRILDQIKVSEEQKAQLAKIRGELQAKLREVQKESFEKALEVLTAEQRKALEDAALQGFQGGYQVIRKQQ